MIDMNSILTKQVAWGIANLAKSAMDAVHKSITGKQPVFLSVDGIWFTEEMVEYGTYKTLSGFIPCNYKSINSGQKVRFSAMMDTKDGTISHANYVVQTFANSVIVMSEIDGVSSSKVFVSGDVHKTVFDFGFQLNKLFKSVPVKNFQIFIIPKGYVIRLSYWDGVSWQPFGCKATES